MPAPKGNDYAVGNSGGGAPEGNTNAVGNAGGSPPLGNGNAVTHGGWSDPAKRFERLDTGARERVAYWFRIYYWRFTLAHGVAPSAADAVAGDDALGIGAVVLGLDGGADVSTRLHRLAVLREQQVAADGVGWTNITVESEREFDTPDGGTVTVTENAANPAIDAGWKLRGRIERSENALGIETGALAPDPDAATDHETDGSADSKTPEEPPAEILTESDDADAPSGVDADAGTDGEDEPPFESDESGEDGRAISVRTRSGTQPSSGGQRSRKRSRGRRSNPRRRRR